MTTLNNIVKMIIEKKDLESRYGWISCFEAPKEYDRMDNLSTDIEKAIREYFNNDFTGFTMEAVRNSLEDAADYIKENSLDIESEDLQISFNTQDDYITEYVVSDTNEQANEMFNNLFYFMGSDLRAAWLRSHYLDHESNTFYNHFVDFVITVQQ
ncbi:hypothetical protein MKY96_33425 [Paenibacillus sp. FSL R7-0302]|uniref:hypothetical protein n=1 Tax=Paenibacillus sp. FSL R7-0302 TaxID=2921681 RepID=UPI0030FC6C04